MPHRSRNSGRALLGGTNSLAGQFLHQTPVQSLRSIQHMQTVLGIQNSLSGLSNFEEGPVFASQIKNSGRVLLGGTNSFVGQFLHQTPVQSSRSIQRIQTAQGFQNPISSLNNFHVGPVFASQIKKLRKSFTWWNQLLSRSVLTPNSCTKFKIHSAHADSPGNPKSTFWPNNFEGGSVFASQIKNSGRALLGRTNSFAGQFLHQTLVQSSRSIQRMQTVQGYQNPISSLNNFHVGPVFASQIKKLGKSYTWWNQLLSRSVLTPNSCTKFKIH